MDIVHVLARIWRSPISRKGPVSVG